MDSEQRHKKRLEAMKGLMEDESFTGAVGVPTVDHLRESFGNKSLGDLIHEMLQIVFKKPELLNPDYEKKDRQIYQAYLDEINRREELYRTVPMQPDMRLYK